MSLELIAAGTLLDMALGGIVGDAASEGAKLLWRTIRNRLVQNQPAIEGEIIEQEEINTIQSWLDNSQIHTLGIQGLGGTGKSFIASYFYQNTNFLTKFWADVSLRPDFTVFAEKIIIALGGEVAFPIDITELINNLLQLLSQRRCLLVVDNLETLLDVERNWQDEYYQQFFSRWLQQGTCSTLLITTQDKPQLFQGVQHWYPSIHKQLITINSL